MGLGWFLLVSGVGLLLGDLVLAGVSLFNGLPFLFIVNRSGFFWGFFRWRGVVSVFLVSPLGEGVFGDSMDRFLMVTWNKYLRRKVKKL